MGIISKIKQKLGWGKEPLCNSTTFCEVIESDRVLKKKMLELRNTISIVEDKYNSKVQTVENTIKYGDLAQLPLNEWSYVHGIKYRLIKIEPNFLVFDTEMDDDASFDKHYHNCLEIATVLGGKLFCPSRKKTIYKGESIFFKPYEMHYPKSIGKTKLIVIFEKP